MCSARKYCCVLVGLVGFRCCGKSTLRGELRELGYSVFDTNSVRTGDPDANRISLGEVLQRYGAGRSYMYFISSELGAWVQRQQGLAFVDSLKTGDDADVLKEILPDVQLEIWYIHASLATRQKRYVERDIRAGVRDGALDEHDQALEAHGILSLIKQAVEVISTEVPRQELRCEIERAILRANVRHGFHPHRIDSETS